MSRNHVARHAHKFNRASVIPDRRDVLIERAVAHETDRERAARLDGGPIMSPQAEREVDWGCKVCGFGTMPGRGFTCADCLEDE